jgi:hypothetical protein
MNASGSKSATGGVNANANASMSASIPEWTVIGSASANENENENGSESEGNKNGRSVYGCGSTRARVRIHVLFARYRGYRNRGRASDGYHDGNLGVAACRLRHAHPPFPSENEEIIWARFVGS